MNARASENYLTISSKSVEIFCVDIYWGRLFLGPNLVSFNRAVVPLFERFNKLKNINICKTS